MKNTVKFKRKLQRVKNKAAIFFLATLMKTPLYKENFLKDLSSNKFYILKQIETPSLTLTKEEVHIRMFSGLQPMTKDI